MFPLRVFWSLVSIVLATSLSSVPALAGENQITSDETHSSSVRLQTGASASTNGSPLAKSALRQNMIETLPAIDASGQLLELLNGKLPDGPCEFTVLIDYDGKMNRLHLREAVGLTQRSARYNAVASVLNGFVPSLCIPLMSAVNSGKVAAPDSGKWRQLAMSNCSLDEGWWSLRSFGFAH